VEDISSSAIKHQLYLFSRKRGRSMVVSRPSPADKKYAISTRLNSDYKWRTSADCLGCLEVPSEPDLLLDAEYTERVVAGNEDAYEYCMEIWKAWNMRVEFIKACHNAPNVTGCCGLLRDDDATIRAIVPELNGGWVRHLNARLRRENMGFQIDCYIWNWHNAIGKAETNILLVRFFEYTPTIAVGSTQQPQLSSAAPNRSRSFSQSSSSGRVRETAITEEEKDGDELTDTRTK
jgi:hypothetical protein